MSSSPDPGTGQTTSNGRSWAPSVSNDGRYTVFLSDASNLVPGDTNGVTDVFVRDNVTTGVTRFTDGVVDSSSRPTISADGSRVAYTVNLTYGGAGVRSTLAVVDRATVSVAFTEIAIHPSNLLLNPSLSSNGTVVAYEFWFLGFQTIAVSTSGSTSTVPRTNGTQTGGAYYPKLNPAGSAVVFDSSEANFVAGDTNGASDVFRWDLPPTNTVTRVSLTSAGGQSNGDSAFADWYDTSTTGAIAFASWADNLVPGDTNAHQDIFTSARPTSPYRTVERIVGGDDDSSLPSVSADGRYVAFTSKATNLVVGDTNGALDVFVKDRLAAAGTPSLWRTSVAYLQTQATGDSSWPQISADGRWVSYETDAPDVAGSDTNGATDVITGFAQTVFVTSVTPALFTRGVVNYPITIRGNGFTAPVTLTVNDASATFSNVVVVDKTTITATITVATNAAPSVTLGVSVIGGPITAQDGSAGECACISTIP